MEKVAVAVLRVAVKVTLAIGVAIHVAVLVNVAEPLLEEGGDVVDHSPELLVTVGLGGLEATSDVSADKGHGHGVLAGEVGGGRVDIGGEDEGAWCLAAGDVGHVGEREGRDQRGEKRRATENIRRRGRDATVIGDQ